MVKTMKLGKKFLKALNAVAIGGAFLLSFGAQASFIFTSSVSDDCLTGVASSTCTGLSQQTASSYIDPAQYSELQGANWVQANGSWNVVGSYSIIETDFSNLNTNSVIQSLFVSFDDQLVISSGGVVLFNSLDYTLSRPWLSPVDIISLVGGPLQINGGDSLVFTVSNRSGPTGLVWKGVGSQAQSNGTAIPGPDVFVIFTLSAILLLTSSFRRIYK